MGWSGPLQRGRGNSLDRKSDMKETLYLYFLFHFLGSTASDSNADISTHPHKKIKMQSIQALPLAKATFPKTFLSTLT